MIGNDSIKLLYHESDTCSHEPLVYFCQACHLIFFHNSLNQLNILILDILNIFPVMIKKSSLSKYRIKL